MAARRRPTAKRRRVRSAAGRRSPRLLVGEELSPAISDAVAQVAKPWRLVVDGLGGNLASSWHSTYEVGISADRRVWVLRMTDWGDVDEPLDEPERRHLAALLDPDTDDDDRIVELLLRATADWFNVDEIREMGDFDVALPDFD